MDGGRAKEFMAKQTAQGKTKRAAWRSLKTYIAREIFKIIRLSYDQRLPAAWQWYTRFGLLWIACGDQDRTVQYERVKAWAESLQQHGIHATFHTYAGAHTWPVWRQSLTEFVPLLSTEERWRQRRGAGEIRQHGGNPLSTRRDKFCFGWCPCGSLACSPASFFSPFPQRDSLAIIPLSWDQTGGSRGERREGHRWSPRASEH
jgi:hypothetical protein